VLMLSRQLPAQASAWMRPSSPMAMTASLHPAQEQQRGRLQPRMSSPVLIWNIVDSTLLDAAIGRAKYKGPNEHKATSDHFMSLVNDSSNE
jgi:hypothetical protein